MRRIYIIALLAFGLSISGSPSLVYAQARVEGRVIDTETQQRLQGVHVFLSGTKIGTSTDSKGNYVLQEIPPGAHRLVVSMIGYGRKTFELVLGPDEHKTMDFGLKPVVYEMNEVFVGNLDKKWKKQLERFEDLFLGETESAESVSILNPEVLRFDTNFWGRLTAEALAPLQIENRALGYSITYYLEEFEHTGTRTRWDGDPVFTELSSSDSLKQSRWEENRKKAFYGSLRHFFLSLLQDRIKEEGFILYNTRESISGAAPDRRFRISRDRLIEPGDEDYLFEMRFFGKLEIIYTEEKEDPRYREWSRDFDRSPRGAQKSWLELNERPITLDADGEVLETYGATQMGYFGYHRLADLTPREYRPEGFDKTNISGVANQ